MRSTQFVLQRHSVGTSPNIVLTLCIEGLGNPPLTSPGIALHNLESAFWKTHKRS
jgi:hypothetical protein